MKLNNIELSFDNFASEMAKLKNEKHFDYLVTIIGEDFGEEGLGCIYILENTQTNERCSVKTIAKKVDGSDVIPTVINLWKVADLLEREVFDFVGIKFLGHPDMRRLFLRTDFQGYPLRKDFDMSPEANKFPCTDEPEDDFTMEYSLSEDGHLVATEKRRFDENDYVVNIGPNHPSTHGVLRLQTVIDGETVKRIYPHLGYIHRGIEKMWENMTYPQTLALTDRLNYLSAMMHRHALVGVIEEAMGIELSDRIRYIRTIMDELQRIDSHLLYLGCTAQDLGALTAFLYCMRDREHVLNVMEETTGGRLIQNYYRIGGLQADIDPNFVQNVKTLCKYLRPMIQEYLDVFGDNVITHNRLEGVGPMNYEDCINYAVTGPAGRASGWKNDTRKRHPYDMYDKVEWKEITQMSVYVSGELKVSGIGKACYGEIFFSDVDDDDKWYKAKLQFITIDEKSEKEKRSNVTYLVQAKSLARALRYIDEVMGKTMIDYDVVGLNETKLMDVFEHHAPNEKKEEKNDVPEYEEK